VVLFQTGCDVIVITPPGGTTRNLFIADFERTTILNGLDVVRLFVFGWDFPSGGEIFGFVCAKRP